MSLWARIYVERRRVLLPLVAILILNVLVLALVVWPMRSHVASTEAEADASTLDLLNARRTQIGTKGAAESQRLADQQLRTFYTDVLPRDLATATKTTNRWLQQAAADAGLEYRAARYEWDHIRDSRLSRAHSTVTLRGRYSDVRRFLHAVEAAEEFIIVESVEVAQPDATQASPDSQLELALDVATYFVTSPAQ
jgi:Tfp pilus assembly protein PilO